MRLSPTERKTIKDVAREVWGDSVRIFLFGSRTDDTRRGGDIDLYIKMDEVGFARELMFQKSEFLSKLDILLGEQKIDVVIDTPENENLPIVKTVRIKGIEL